jgi:hypothetical protein
MGYFKAIAKTAVIARLGKLLRGCSHRRTSRPITLRTGSAARTPNGALSEMYMVCLECGRQFAYDWNAMRIVPQRRVWLRSLLPGSPGKSEAGASAGKIEIPTNRGRNA